MTAFGEVHECGTKGKFKRKVKMDKDDRPICFKISLKPVEGKVDKKTCNIFSFAKI